MSSKHTSVLANELLSFFEDFSIGCLVDATLGAGGHSETFLKAHPEINLLIGIDQDPIARGIAQQRLMPWEKKLKIFPGNFSNLEKFLKAAAIEKVSGMIFDLGVSSMQLDTAEKGFSFLREGPLDMRMDPTNPLTAGQIVNGWTAAELGRIFRLYGEEKQWRRIAHAIVAKRPFETTTALADFIQTLLPRSKKGIHPATLVFQALRIAVNEELQVLEKTLPIAIDHLAPGGILGVISFHSLEDRIVKNLFRSAASDKENTSGLGGLFLDKEPEIEILTRKPIIASEEEIRNNPRSRSAKLRVVRKR